MCGIAGIVSSAPLDLVQMEGLLRSAIQVQLHRGPDASGIYLDEKACFAHNRLSILDLSVAGAQPMWSRSRRYVITYNGEIYNFRELAETYGLDLRSRSDTEVILEAFEKVGSSIFSELNGMFAFALHDIEKNAVWLVRDRLGIKPLYLSLQDKRIAFASEIKGLFALGFGLEKRLRVDALHEWVYFGNALGARTMFHGVDQLEPGHCLRIDLGSWETERRKYWSIEAAIQNLQPAQAMKDPVAAAEKTRKVLEASVQRQLVSDVQVGIFLSGGLDSSSIACLASQHATQKLTTYSAAFDYDEEKSELALAAEVARHCGSDHREIRIGGGDGAEVVRKMVESHDQPFSDAANIPLYLMSNSIGSTHKVILQGDGGDEMFGGYQRHLTLLKYGPYRKLLSAFKGVANLSINNVRFQRVARMVAALAETDDAKAMALLLSVERENQKPSLIFGDQMRRRVLNGDPFQRYRQIEKQFEGKSIAEKMLLVDKSIILPDIFFQKVDRSTMAASVEVRVPFTDNELLDHVLGLSPKVLMNGGVQKGLLRAAMKDVLPASVLHAKKRGFGVPFGYWVTGAFSEQFRDVTTDLCRKYPGVLDLEHIEAMWRDHKAGVADHSFMFWKILNLALWMRAYNVSI